jgi:hypothetical protein
MTNQRNTQAESTVALRMCTHEAAKAIPYLRALVGWLHEHWRHLRRVGRLDHRPVRRNRQETRRSPIEPLDPRLVDAVFSSRSFGDSMSRAGRM